MKIEDGKIYRTRNGAKMRIKRSVSLPEHIPWFGLDERGWGYIYFADGKRNRNGENEYDLVAEWADDVYSEGDTQLIASAAPEVPDPVSHPPHYTGHPSGVECIQITEHMNFNRGNAVKYIWRAGEKGDEIQDLEKAVWYLQREIARIKK